MTAAVTFTSDELRFLHDLLRDVKREVESARWLEREPGDGVLLAGVCEKVRVARLADASVTFAAEDDGFLERFVLSFELQVIAGILRQMAREHELVADMDGTLRAVPQLAEWASRLRALADSEQIRMAARIVTGELVAR